MQEAGEGAGELKELGGAFDRRDKGKRREAEEGEEEEEGNQKSGQSKEGLGGLQPPTRSSYSPSETVQSEERETSTALPRPTTSPLFRAGRCRLSRFSASSDCRSAKFTVARRRGGDDDDDGADNERKRESSRVVLADLESDAEGKTTMRDECLIAFALQRASTSTTGRRNYAVKAGGKEYTVEGE